MILNIRFDNSEQPAYRTPLSLGQNPNLSLVYILETVYDCLQNKDTRILTAMGLSFLLELHNCDDLQTVVTDVRIMQKSWSTNSYMIEWSF